MWLDQLSATYKKALTDTNAHHIIKESPLGSTGLRTMLLKFAACFATYRLAERSEKFSHKALGEHGVLDTI